MKSDRVLLHECHRCRLVAEFYKGMVFLHFRVTFFNARVLSYMLTRWPDVRRSLAAAGYPVVNAFYRESNTLMPKFAARFGFREIRRNNGWVLLENDHA